MWIRCLTVCQPYAWAIVKGIKPVENRTKNTRFRGRLYIHSGKSEKMLYPTHKLANGIVVPKEELIFGAIIGYVDVIDSAPMLIAPPNPFNIGPFCWVLENAVMLQDPIQWRGALGIFSANVQTLPLEHQPLKKDAA